MIASFRHKGLEPFSVSGSRKGIRPDHAAKLTRILGMLDVAQEPRDLNIPSFRTHHQLKGELSGTWAIWVNGNWRIAFRFIGVDVEIVDYRDYH